MHLFNDLLQKSTLSVLRRHFKLHLTHKAINYFWRIYFIIFCSVTLNVEKKAACLKFIKCWGLALLPGDLHSRVTTLLCFHSVQNH